MNSEIDLNCADDFGVEEIPEGNALGCVFSASTSSTASCPGSSAASLGSASTLG